MVAYPSAAYSCRLEDDVRDDIATLSNPASIESGKDPTAGNPVCKIDASAEQPSIFSGKVGNPISVYSGNNFETAEDLSFPSPGGSSFTFRRYYNSRSALDNSMGQGWTTNYAAYLKPDVSYRGGVYLGILDETGRAVYFAGQGGGIYTGAFNERTTVKVVSGSYVWYRLDGSRFVFSAANNKLIRIEEPSGNRRMLTYDANRRLLSVLDEAGGRLITFHYNASDRVDYISGPTTAAVPDGIWVRYGYDANDNLISVTYADGSGFNYEYSTPSNHNLTAKKDKAGHLLSSWTYDGQDRAITNFTRDGKGVGINYVSANEVRVTDAYGTVRTYAVWDIDGRRKVTDVSGPSGCADCVEEVSHIEYDSQGRVIEVEHAGGRIDQYGDFDGRGNPRFVREAAGTSDEKTIFYTYHPDTDARLSRAEASLIGPGDRVTIWDYDSDGNETPNESPTRLVYRLIERGFTRDGAGVVVPYESITAYTYNSKGQVLSIDGPLSGSHDLVAFTYDASSGDLLAVTRPLVGTVTYAEYDGAGQAGRIVDENGRATMFTYDGKGRIKTVTSESDGSTTTYTYNTAGELQQIIAANGVAASFEYDETHGRLTRLLDPLGNYMSYSYDSQGNRIEQSIYNRSGLRKFWQRFDYQSPQHPGKLWKEINPDNTYTEYGYTASGNIEAVTDPAGKTTVYTYGIRSRLNSVNQPGGVQTLYGYDKNDNLIRVTDAEGHATFYTYDDQGRLLSTDSPDTGVATYAYDMAGNLVSKTDAKGITVEYSYDILNRLTGIFYPDPSQNVGYTYDEGPNGMGRLTGMTDPSGTAVYTYDAKGNLSAEIRTVAGVAYTTSYTYDAAGTITGVIYPEGRSVTYELDAAGRVARVVTVKDGDVRTLADSVNHLPFGPITSMIFGNGLGLTGSFDQLYRPATVQTGTVYDRRLSYDLSGNISSIEDLLDSLRSQSFQYDALNRLTAAEGSYGFISYVYDKIGNRLSKNQNGTLDLYRYISGTSRLAEADGIPYNYDVNGNPVAVGTRSFTYSQNNRLIRAAENGSVLGEYVYNALGQRAVKTVAGRTTVFLYDRQGNLLAEADAKGNIVQEYIWLEGRLLGAIKSGKELIEADVDMDPDTLNIDSNGKWVTAYIELPEGFDAAEIDPASIMLNRAVYADRVEAGDHNDNGIPELMVKFDRGQAASILESGEGVEMLVEGEAENFKISGTDTIRVIGKGKKNKNRQSTAALAQTATTLSLNASNSSRIVFYHLDHLGTPQVITDENGEVVWQTDYLPFGEVDVTVNAFGNGFRFPGQYYDAETGLHYNYHRYYDPMTGRYLTPDPVGLAGMDPNLYGYVLNNPVNMIDPLGLWVQWLEALYWIIVDNSTPHPGITQILISGALMDDTKAGREYLEGRISELERTIKGKRRALINEHYAAMARCDALHNDPCENKKCREKAYDNYVNAAMRDISPHTDKLATYIRIKRTFFNYN
ncbi:MAG: RHS repeat-associated core domain-containing protein [Thermodesulfobacteriota bacterium]